MHHSKHKLFFKDSRNLSFLENESVDLVVTSPPYPMIQMWDELFSSLNSRINDALHSGRSDDAFELMHDELDKVWFELFRVLKNGGFACINIGDATRTIEKKFQLFPNHARIITGCKKAGFDVLPEILWRKQTNAPNKFMGSGMLPAGAYVTLEHEYVLILRKGEKRVFQTENEKINRRVSSYFWEERNIWFSDLWDLKGVKQGMNNKKTRERSAAFPFEVAYRLINMYSVKGDVIIDPFLGTGTTMLAAIASARNSIGVEVDENFNEDISQKILLSEEEINSFILRRLNNHIDFVQNYKKIKNKEMKYKSKFYSFPVMTKSEAEMVIPTVKKIFRTGNDFEVDYIKNFDFAKEVIDVKHSGDIFQMKLAL